MRARLFAVLASLCVLVGVTFTVTPAARADTIRSHTYYWSDGTTVAADVTIHYSGSYAAVTYYVERLDANGDWYVVPYSIRFGDERLYSDWLIGAGDHFGGASHWEGRGTEFSLRLFDQHEQRYQTWSVTT